jgi:hypothetical protein
MIALSDLLKVADAYIEATAIKEVTLSHRLFGDSKKLAALRSGADITVGRFNGALGWFAANWPPEASWPDSIERPAVSEVSP